MPVVDLRATAQGVGRCEGREAASSRYGALAAGNGQQANGGSAAQKAGSAVNKFPHPDFDLFGNAIRQSNGKRGRPRHAPSEAQRGKVERLCKIGFSRPEIARMIGITAPTLLLHYHRELQSTSQAWRRHEGDKNE